MMASVENGRFTARIDGSFVAFTIGMWLPLHKGPAAVDRGVTEARSIGAPHSTPIV
jgi:hypothetical protein